LALKASLFLGDRTVTVGIDRLEQLLALGAVGALGSAGLELVEAERAAGVAVERLEAWGFRRGWAKAATDAADAGHDRSPSRHRRMAAPWSFGPESMPEG
jgi:hypothetical protein